MSTLDDHDVTGGGPATAEPIAEVAPARHLTPGESARTLIQHADRAVLATLSVDADGHPFGSVAPYGLLQDGRPVVCISRLAEHTRNLDGDGRASVLVTEAHPMGDPMDNGRLTLLGSFRPVEGDEAAAYSSGSHHAMRPKPPTQRMDAMSSTRNEKSPKST
jgi:hypothetical protein